MRLAARVMVAVSAGALTVVLLAGCGGPGKTKQTRDALNAYLDGVDRAQAPLLEQVGQIDQELATFSFTKTTPAALRGLQAASATVGSTLRRLRAIEPPPAARRLRALLLERLALQAKVVDELLLTERYIPRLGAALAPLTAATAGLGRSIAAVKAPPPTPAGTGEQLWTAAGCGSCHVLAQPGSTGRVGPNLDALRPSQAAVAAQVVSGGGGMPSYRTALTTAQVDRLAAYVAAVAGHPGATAPGVGAGAAASRAAPDVYQQYAAAFAGYRIALGPILAGLGRVTAPLELRPGLVAERQALDRSVTLCKQIEAALQRHDVAGANRSIQQLFEVASGVNSPGLRKAQAAAARAYDAQLTKIDNLATRVARERARLVQVFG